MVQHLPLKAGTPKDHSLRVQVDQIDTPPAAGARAVRTEDMAWYCVAAGGLLRTYNLPPRVSPHGLVPVKTPGCLRTFISSDSELVASSRTSNSKCGSLQGEITFVPGHSKFAQIRFP